MSAVEPWQVFSQQLRKARRAKSWAPRQLADRIAGLGFSAPTDTRIRQIEAGGLTGANEKARQRAKGVRLEEVIACAAALGVAPAWLLSPFYEEDAEPVKLGNWFVAPNAFQHWVRGYSPLHVWRPGRSEMPTLDEDFFYWFEFAPRWLRERLLHEGKRADPDRPMDTKYWLARTRRDEIVKLIAAADVAEQREEEQQ